jgi:hypothetical protein
LTGKKGRNPEKAVPLSPIGTRGVWCYGDLMRSEQRVQITDLQTSPFVKLPKVFFTRFKPTHLAQGVYSAIKFFASTKTGTSEYTSIPTMAALVDLSESSFRRGLKELVRKGIVRVRHRTRKMPGGKRQALPNHYEIVNLDLTPAPADDDAPI